MSGWKQPDEKSVPSIRTRKAVRQRDLTFHIHTEKRSGSATPENDGQNAATTQIMQQLMTQLAISFLENGKYSNGSSVKPESELVIGSVLPLYSLVISSPFYMRLSTRPLYIRLLKISIFLLPKMSMNSLLTVLLKYSVSVTQESLNRNTHPFLPWTKLTRHLNRLAADPYSKTILMLYSSTFLQLFSV